MELQEAVCADRSARGKLRFEGPQRAWFLHQVLTQAFEDVVAGEARDAAMITPHGRMLGYLEVLALEDALLAHFEPELARTLPEDLARYVFATRVTIEDVTDDMGLVLVAGPGFEDATRSTGAVAHPTRGLGIPAAYLWIEGASAPELLSHLESEGFRRAEEEELELVRVANGVPRWGRDMDSKTIPQEVGVDGVAVHYDKGCYLGQEAMAKIHFRGKINRHLARLEGDGALAGGVDVLLDGARVGRVTSAAGERALAIIRRDVEEGATVQAGGARATVLG
jgi:tRNA-modifying protein YgfZ